MTFLKKNIILCIVIILSIYCISLAQKWTTYTNSNGLPCANVPCIAIDKQGNEWFGGCGLIKFDGATWTILDTTNSNSPSNNINPIAIDLVGNKLVGWTKSNINGLSKFDGTSWANFDSLPPVRTIDVDTQGNIWIGTFGSGVLKFDGTTWTKYAVSDGIAANYITCMDVDKKNNIWVGCINYGNNGIMDFGGVSKFDGINWTTYDSTKGLAGMYVLSIAIDSQNVKWFGTYRHGISRFDDSLWKTFSTKEGLVNDVVSAIAVDQKGNKWFGTEGGGVSEFNGTAWTAYTAKSGLYGNCLADNNVYKIAIDHQNNKWFLLHASGVSMLNDTAQPIIPPLSAYSEGIDTTDVNGYSHDSTFQVKNDSLMAIKNGLGAISYLTGDGGGVFPYRFDDLKMAPVIAVGQYSSGPFRTYNSIALRKNNGTYSKFQVIGKLPDKRYIYKYAMNSTPNDLMLEKHDYDRSIRYKPNNFSINFVYILRYNSLNWDPPLPNNNHLLGYTLFESKADYNAFDTNAPINLAQWDSIAFISAGECSYTGYYWPNKYLNLVAVYSEGRSDFLRGWAYFYSTAVGIKEYGLGKQYVRKGSIVNDFQGGIIFNFSLFQKGNRPTNLSIFTPSGKQIACFQMTNDKPIFWNATRLSIAEGVYIAKINQPNNINFSFPFLYKR
jgi:hypothetical protein